MERFEEATPSGELVGNPSGVSEVNGGADLLERLAQCAPTEWCLELKRLELGWCLVSREYEGLLVTDDDYFSSRALILLLDHLESLGFLPSLCRHRDRYIVHLLPGDPAGYDGESTSYLTGATRIEAVVRALIEVSTVISEPNKALESATPPSEKSEAKPHPE